jgi:hypothetical protein
MWTLLAAVMFSLHLISIALLKMNTLAFRTLPRRFQKSLGELYNHPSPENLIVVFFVLDP